MALMAVGLYSSAQHSDVSLYERGILAVLVHRADC
jgi:hypothetical protein